MGTQLDGHAPSSLSLDSESGVPHSPPTAAPPHLGQPGGDPHARLPLAPTRACTSSRREPTVGSQSHALARVWSSCLPSGERAARTPASPGSAAASAPQSRPLSPSQAPAARAALRRTRGSCPHCRLGRPDRWLGNSQRPPRPPPRQPGSGGRGHNRSNSSEGGGCHQPARPRRPHPAEPSITTSPWASGVHIPVARQGQVMPKSGSATS